MKSESQKTNKNDTNALNILTRFSSATSKGNENILEIDTLKSTSKDSRNKKSNQKMKKCKKKSNLINYLGKNQAAKVRLQSRVHKSNEVVETVRPHTVQDYVIKPPSCSSKKSDKATKSKPNEGSGRFIKSSKTRMTSDLVNLINKTKKEVENLRAFRRSSKHGQKSTSKKSNAISPLGEKIKDDEYGINDHNKKTLSHNKSDKIAVSKKRIENGSQSNRKMKLKSTAANFHPHSGIIDLVSRNDRCVSQISNEDNACVHSINSRKSSHKHTNSIESSERSDNKSKQRFLVSKKYNKKMAPTKLTLSKDAVKS